MTMTTGSVQLTKRQVMFLMSKFQTDDPEEAIDFYIEYLVTEGMDPMEMCNHLNRMTAKENN